MMFKPSAFSLIILQGMISVSAADAVVPFLRKGISSSTQEDHLQLGHHARALAESYTGQCFASQTTYCQDNPDYRTWKGLPCSSHADLISPSTDENCFHEWLLDSSWFSEFYDQDQIFELVWECPCACNVQCHEDDRQEFDDEEEKDERPASFDFGIANDTDTSTTPPTPAPTDHSFTTGGFGEIGVPAEALNRPEDEVNTMSVITPAVSAEGSDLSSPSPSHGAGILSLQNGIGVIAIIAAVCVIVAVFYISVFSLLRSDRKGHEEENVISATSIDCTGTLPDASRDGSGTLSKAASEHMEEEEDNSSENSTVEGESVSAIAQPSLDMYEIIVDL